MSARTLRDLFFTRKPGSCANCFFPPFRPAALKCRQRKKAWLNQLQTRVDGLTAENERLKNIVSNLTDEVGRVSTVLGQHRDCPGMAQSLAQVGLVPPMPNGGPYGVGIVPPQPPAPPRMIGTMSRD